MFDSASVKELRKQAEQIGNFHGMAFCGDLSGEDFRDVLEHPDTRLRLKQAWTLAAQDVGVEKATSRAVKAARAQAEAYLFVRNIRGRAKADLENSAEQAVRALLA